MATPALVAAVMVGLAGVAVGQPTPVVPTGTDVSGASFEAPGRFPNVATGANWFLVTPTNFPQPFTNPAAVALGVSAQNPIGFYGNFYNLLPPQTPVAADSIYLVDIATGPVPFTTGTLNNGDNDLNIGANTSGVNPAFPLTTASAVTGLTLLDIENEVIAAASGVSGQFGDGFWDAFRNSSAFNVEALNLRNGQPTYSWAADAAFGVMLGSVMNHRRDNQVIGLDFLEFAVFGRLTPVSLGARRGHISITPGRGAGVGYNMSTGEFFGNGGTGTRPTGAIFVTTNQIDPDLAFEFTVDYSTFWFPFSQGWVGAWISTDDAAGETTPRFRVTNDGAGNQFDNGTSGLSDAVVAWDNLAQARGSIDFTRAAGPGGTPADSMLFMISADNPAVGAVNPQPFDLLQGSYPNIIGVRANGTGWQFAIRQSDSTQAAGIAPPPSLAAIGGSGVQNEFAFVNIPFDACDLVGAVVNPNGTIGTGQSAGAFSIENIATGRYAIGVHSTGNANRTDQEGGLLLQITGDLPNGGLDGNLATAEPDRGYIGYDYNPAYVFADGRTGAFVVETFEFLAAGDVLRPAGFAFAYFDFTRPFSIIRRADLNGDGLLNIFDIFAYFNVFGAGNVSTADFAPRGNPDGVLNVFDIFEFFASFGAGGC